MVLWWEGRIPRSRVGSRRSSRHTGRSGSTVGRTFGRGCAATQSQQTPEKNHICWCWNKVINGEAWCQMCVVIFHSPRKAAAMLSRELFLGRAGTWLQSRGTGSSRVQQAFLGAAGIRPLLGETLPQRGGTGQSRSPSEVRGRGKQPHLRQNLREVLPGAWSQTVKKWGVNES